MKALNLFLLLTPYTLMKALHTQGDPLAMPFYAWAMRPLIGDLSTGVPDLNRSGMMMPWLLENFRLKNGGTD